MTPQERINQLTRAALAAAPPTPSIPKPATYTPNFAQPVSDPAQVAAVLSAAVPVGVQGAYVPAAPVQQAIVQPVAQVTPAEAAAPEFKDEGDPLLRAMIEERDVKKKTRMSRQKWTVNGALAASLVALVVWYQHSPTAQAKVHSLVPAFHESMNDVKTLASITKKFDSQLEKVAVRGNQVDEATRAMGGDPTKPDDGKGDPAFDEDMRKMMGEEGGKTTADRNKSLQDKFGFVGKLAGRTGKPGAGVEANAGEPAAATGPAAAAAP